MDKLPQFSRNGIETVQLLVKLPAEAKAEIAELARRKDMTQSAVVRDAIYRYMQADQAQARAERTTT